MSVTKKRVLILLAGYVAYLLLAIFFPEVLLMLTLVTMFMAINFFIIKYFVRAVSEMADWIDGSASRFERATAS